jgi:hypothetical protein
MWEAVAPPLLGVFLPLPILQAFLLLIAWCVLLLLPSPAWLVCLQLTWDVGVPPSPVEFSSLSHFYKLSCSWLLGSCGHSCFLWLACLFTAPCGIPLTPLWCSGPPTLFAVCLFLFGYCLLFSFSFFLSVGVGLSRGLC